MSRGRSDSSARWLREHHTDAFVRRSKVEGYRSRAAYKLEELLERDLLLKPGMVIVDLGAAPGGWSQLLAARCKGRCRIVAIDLLDMPPIDGVDFLQADFTSEDGLAALDRLIDAAPVDLVLSDMAPNMTGVKDVDIVRSYALAELALDFAQQRLKPGGSFAIKLFQGEGFDPYLRALRASFGKVLIRKPEASRDRSRELYALALQRKPT